MRIWIKKARIIAPGQPLNGMIRDIWIEGGIIGEIAERLPDREADQVVEGEQLHVSPGWMDVFAHFCDPGYEYKEDLGSGADAAAAGGYTEVLVIPDTQPPLQSKSMVEYVVRRTASLPVRVRPIGAVSRDLEGAALAEMYEMWQSGAIAFSDGLSPLQSSGLLLKALQYVKAFDGVIIQIPEDISISQHGLMHEGLWSTRLGMPGKAAIAEEILLKRDLELLRYTGSRMHVTGISLRRSAELIRQAREAGLQVTCSVTPHHLLLDDSALQGYDSHLKVNPPLRDQAEVAGLRQAVMDGWVDCFATHHHPQDPDSKQKEFEYAGEGMIGLESAFGVLGLALPELSLERKIAMLTTGPRQVFGIPVPRLEQGQPANLTLFDPDAEWVFEQEHLASRSRNSPFLGKTLKGRVRGTVLDGHMRVNS